MPSTRDVPTRRTSVVKRVLLGLLTTVLALALLEGVASIGLLCFDLLTRSRAVVAERQHTEYDSVLGWVHIPGRVVPDMYGPGRTVTISRQGFRNKREFAERVPPGKTRIVCSGDSFTLGYGVDDDDTWAAVLERSNPDLEVVNMGQGGYGLDQAFLWYERDGRKIDHQVHLFGITLYELERLQSDRFMGYGKPTLEYEAGRVVAASVPVPRRAFYVPWLTRNAEIFRRTRIGQWMAVFGDDAGKDEEAARMTLREVVQLTLQVLRQVDEGDRAHGSRLAVVWLPVRRDRQPSSWDAARAAILGNLQELGIPTLDLVPDLRRLPEEQARELFLGESDVRYADAKGHYNEAGNLFIAERVGAFLRDPSLAGERGLGSRP